MPGHPARALLGEHELQVGVAFEHAREDQVPQRAVRVDRDLDQHHRARRGIGDVEGREAAAAVVVDDDAELLAQRPQRLVHVGPQRRDLVVRRHARQQHAAEEAGVRGELALRPSASSTSFSRICATPARRPGAAAQKSASQRLCACSPAHRCSYSAAVGAGVTSAPDGKNGGIVFGNSTSATMPSASSSASARVGVPVAVRVRSGEVVERVAVGLRPRVELVVPARREVLAVRRDRRARVTVGRDDRVAIGVSLRRFLPLAEVGRVRALEHRRGARAGSTRRSCRSAAASRIARRGCRARTVSATSSSGVHSSSTPRSAMICSSWSSDGYGVWRGTVFAYSSGRHRHASQRFVRSQFGPGNSTDARTGDSGAQQVRVQRLGDRDDRGLRRRVHRGVAERHDAAVARRRVHDVARSPLRDHVAARTP